MKGQYNGYRHYHEPSSYTGATITDVPRIRYTELNTGSMSPLLSDPETRAYAFMADVTNNQHAVSFDDMLTQKRDRERDNINLIIADIAVRKNITDGNLTRLYRDLLLIDNWRLERPFPDCYQKDRLWSDLNRMELQIRDQIRRELKDSARDTAFPRKDLRESLLEFKLQTHKSRLVEGGLEMGLDGPSEPNQGDMYQQTPPY